MTVEEIKQTTSMRDVLARYNVSVNRNNMCYCPIHKEKHASMKVFSDGYNCFACGANGDIFSFVQAMEDCSFKEAFLILGGTYEKDENKKHQKLIQAKFKRQRQRQIRQQSLDHDFKTVLSKGIRWCRKSIRDNEPMSDKWCKAQKYLPWLEYTWEQKYIKGEEVNELDVYRTCKGFEE